MNDAYYLFVGVSNGTYITMVCIFLILGEDSNEEFLMIFRGVRKRDREKFR
jgi:hypothetical protein